MTRAPEQLAALADGTLPDYRRAELEAVLASSPEWARALEEQRRVVRVMRAVAAEPPLALRERVEAQRRSVPARRCLVAPLAAGALALVVLAVLLVLPSSSGPTLGEAAALGSRPPVDAALLPVSQSGVEFRDWSAKSGWWADGLRRDGLDGRDTTTVYYRNEEGARLAYTVVSGEALEVPPSASRSVVAGTVVRDYVEGSRRVVTWERAGHTCVMTGPVAVKRQVMLELAARS